MLFLTSKQKHIFNKLSKFLSTKNEQKNVLLIQTRMKKNNENKNKSSNDDNLKRTSTLTKKQNLTKN